MFDDEGNDYPAVCPYGKKGDLIWVRVRFFFKQWGGVRKHVTGRMLKGRTSAEMPHVTVDTAIHV